MKRQLTALAPPPSSHSVSRLRLLHQLAARPSPWPSPAVAAGPTPSSAESTSADAVSSARGAMTASTTAMASTAMAVGSDRRPSA